MLADSGSVAARWLLGPPGDQRLRASQSLLALIGIDLFKRINDTHGHHVDDRVLHDFAAVAPGLRVTFSAGLARCGAEDSVELAVERADQAMYRAKTQGRNGSVLA